MIRSLTAALAIAGSALLAPAIASADVISPVLCHSTKCEDHKIESRAHVPHHIHHGVRW